MNRIPEEIKVIYIAFLKNHDMVSAAMEDYYTDPTAFRRVKLLQELARTLKGTMSQKLIMAEKAIPILDQYNTISNLFEKGLWENIDFEDTELLTILNKAGLAIK
jgi:hypothetical protein